MLQGALYGMKWATDPARVFHHINQLLCDHADLGKYATAFFGIVEESGRLEYINAGHPSPILIRKDGAQEAFTDGSLPIGLVPEAEFTTSTYQRQPNDMLVLYNDGVTEAVDPEEQLYGVGRLRAVLSGKNEMPLDEIQRAVLESLESFVHGVRQEDDVALLLVRFRAVD
jgi:serine phosphatase RsbU (regulator of sigma subunit)